MKCLLFHCHEELAQLTALTLIVGVGWVELWECPNHGVWSIPKGRETMKEVRCDGVEGCTRRMEVVTGPRPHWCHAATPHPVNEACERSYCMEVRRQVHCKPVEAPATFTALVYESGVHASVLDVLRGGIKSGEVFNESMAARITARIMNLSRHVSPSTADTMQGAFKAKRMKAIIREAIDHLHDGTATDNAHISRAVDRIIALPEWTPRIRQEGGE